ncbi:unnamed protein product [Pleuronectes platessa]|uniref:Uncharacterized protein n=1 Tax=Pleuronectes platessa TaxID=8262 RepID=A0A9N7YY67_PLEPL|nr:unnamed protein product [Pleuronectes platessa]
MTRYCSLLRRLLSGDSKGKEAGEEEGGAQSDGGTQEQIRGRKYTTVIKNLTWFVSAGLEAYIQRDGAQTWAQVVKDVNPVQTDSGSLKPAGLSGLGPRNRRIDVED